MIYFDQTVCLLQAIIEKKKSLENILDTIKQETVGLVEACDTLVLCGTLPYSIDFSAGMAKTKNCYYLDSGDGEGMYAGCPLVSVTDLKILSSKHKVLYIIMSRSMLEFYNFVIKKTDPFADTLYYASVELTYEDAFQCEAREDYTPSGIKDSVHYVVDHAKEIRDFLLTLDDVVSQEIFARMVLFRLSFNVELNFDVKSDKTEYLDDNIIKWKDKECIVDLGGYVGDTLFDFQKYFVEKNIEYEYWLLEPSKENCDQARIVAGDSTNIHIVNCCAGNENKTVCLNSTMGSAITISLSETQNGEDTTNMVKLDDLLSEEDITYIKMDIEGSEEIALKGAERIIKNNRPKLAVCLYHKYDDIVRLVDLVRNVTDGLNYKYFIRAQRESVVTEMVMYALPQ